MPGCQRAGNNPAGAGANLANVSCGSLSNFTVFCSPLQEGIYAFCAIIVDAMDVFISWSGERSRTAAEALRGWLPKIINAI
jgi:hypothetical protein